MPGSPSPSARILLGVGLLAGTTLALQVLLTRIFSAVLFYHFSFLAISLALLGIGSGAILVYVRPQWFSRRTLDAELARWSLAFAAMVAVSTFVLVRLDYTYLKIDVHFVWTIALTCVLAYLPFAAAGVAIALAVRAYAASIGRLYAADLAGAGIGALAVVPLLWLFDAPTLIVSLCVIGALAALLFAGRAPEAARLAAGGVVVAGVLLALSATTNLFYLAPAVKPVSDRWTPLSRVLGYAPFGGSKNGLVIYDRVIAEVPVYRRGERPPGWKQLQEGPQSIGYKVTGPGDALIIGGGGGRDILDAYGNGQRIDVIELNRAIRDTVDDDLAKWSGSPYTLPGVSTAIGDGRSTLARRDKTYSQITLGFTDTYSSNSGQAFALTENNLYTVEAFREYLRHLRPNGILNVSRPDRDTGNEAVRLTALTLEALRQEGVRNPERNVVVLLGVYGNVFNGFPYGTVLAKRTPFTASELAKIRALARTRSTGIAYAPGGPFRGQWAALAAAPTPQAFCEKASYNLCPPTDDKPFFFNMRRLSDIGDRQTRGPLSTPDPIFVLGATLLVLLALSAITLAAPLLLARDQPRPGAGPLSFFAFIGLGYLTLEIVLIQRFVLFLGFPTYALSVVLFSLLLFTGLGALLSTRFTAAPRRALIGALGTAIALIIAATLGLQPLLESLIDLPFAARVALSVAMMAPVAVALGMAMPLGMTRLAAGCPTGVPWAWGVNGIASVVASALAVAVAISFGFTVATIVAGLWYAGALAHAAFGRWPAADAGGDPVTFPSEPGELLGALPDGPRA